MTVMEVSKPVKSGRSERSRSACSLSFVPVTPVGGELGAAAAADEKETLRLGHLLGKCAYGSVFSSLWRGAPVAVKVWGEVWGTQCSHYIFNIPRSGSCVHMSTGGCAR